MDWLDLLATGKDLDAGRDWGQEKGMTEDEMAGWHHQHDGCEFECEGNTEDPGTASSEPLLPS